MSDRHAEPVELLPDESLALTAALVQIQRGERPSPNVGAMCVLALARITGKYDWTEQADE